MKKILDLGVSTNSFLELVGIFSNKLKIDNIDYNNKIIEINSDFLVYVKTVPSSYQDSIFNGLEYNQIFILSTDSYIYKYNEKINEIKIIIDSFSKSEIEKIKSLNPIVKYFSKNKVKNNEYNIIIREHLLLEKLNLVMGLIDSGFSVRDIYFIAKEDKTKYNSKVLNTFKNIGINTIIINDRINIPRILKDLSKSFRHRRSIILDDGGDIILNFDSRINDIFIETTTKGIECLKSKPYFYRIYNLSDTVIKYQLNHAIANSCVFNFINLTKYFSVYKKRILIIGYGKIGFHIANIFSALGSHVYIYDIDTKKYDANFTFIDSIDNLKELRLDIIFSCVGKPIISPEILRSLDNDIILSSISSQDFKLLIPLAKNKGELIDGLGYVVNYFGNKITLLGEGHAINLYNYEGVNELDYDSFIALELLTIINSADNLVTPSDINSIIKEITQVM